MPGFRNVRPPTREMVANQEARDASMSAAEKTIVGRPDIGQKSPHFFQDPIVEALAKRPSLDEASSYAGTKPSFYGVQRPEDYQRTIQRQMAADELPGGREELARLVQNRITRARIGNVNQ